MEWRKIPGFGRYSVSDTGLVRRDVRTHNTPAGMVSLSRSDFGYAKCSLTSDLGQYKTVLVHVLVAAAFIGPRPDGMVVCHGDRNPQNNAKDNIRYDTHTGNVADAIGHGTQVRGCGQHLAKLDDAAVATARQRFIEEAITVKALADEFGISDSSMLSIVKGETWTHVSPHGDLRRLRKRPPSIGFRGGKKTSSHKGVSFATRRRKWVARCRNAGKVICLGEFETENEAFSAVLACKAGLAKPTGETAPTASGRQQRIWRAL